MDLYVDLRCLQDADYQYRGIGLHTAAVLRHARRFLGAGLRIRGMIDELLPKLPETYRPLVDDLQHSWLPQRSDSGTLFLQPSPMTHRPDVWLPLLSRRSVLACTLVYDFIPLDDATRYLPTQAAYENYGNQLAWLKRFHLYCPISVTSGNRLRELLNISPTQIHVTGASVRDVFTQNIEWPSPVATDKKAKPYFIAVCGEDARKNPEVVLRAHAGLSREYRKSTSIVIVGNYSIAGRRRLQQDYQNWGGFPQNLKFLHGVSDEALASYYRHAIAAISPSKREGFSLPVVEAIGSGCPVLVSDIDVHRELIEQPEARFAPDDHRRLSEAMQLLLTQPPWRNELWTAQQPIVSRFREEAVARRVWSHVRTQTPIQGVPGILPAGHGKPRIAFLTPYAPDRSGVADYSASTLRRLSEHAIIDVYTSCIKPRRDPWVRGFYPVTPRPYLSDEYDQVVSVLGNSTYHQSIFELHHRYGGPCIEHDNRLAEYYAWVRGHDRYVQMASRYLQREVTLEEARSWLQEPWNLPTLFFEEILPKSTPLIVHSRGLQARVSERYGHKAEYLPFCCYRDFNNRELTERARQEARRRLGWPENRFAIISLGIVAHTKGLDECMFALEQLHAWGIAADFHFVGEVGPEKDKVLHLADHLGLRSFVHFSDRWISEASYRDSLLAADLAMQLRLHRNGGISGALSDCISAGLPCVVNDDLGKALDSPDYVYRIPDDLSPLLIAEQAANCYESGRHRYRIAPERDQYIQDHSFQHYAVRLMELLGLAA